MWSHIGRDVRMPLVIESAHAVKTPRQQRSSDSLERILKTAETLIRNKGYEALTVAEVVRRSNTSIGTFYARFQDKTALLHAVQERVHGREETQIRDEAAKIDWEALSLEETVRSLVDIKQEATNGNDRLLEAFVVYGATDPVLRERGYTLQSAGRGPRGGYPYGPCRPDRSFGPRVGGPGGFPALAGRPGGERAAVPFGGSLC